MLIRFERQTKWEKKHSRRGHKLNLIIVRGMLASPHKSQRTCTGFLKEFAPVEVRGSYSSGQGCILPGEFSARDIAHCCWPDLQARSHLCVRCAPSWWCGHVVSTCVCARPPLACKILWMFRFLPRLSNFAQCLVHQETEDFGLIDFLGQATLEKNIFGKSSWKEAGSDRWEENRKPGTKRQRLRHSQSAQKIVDCPLSIWSLWIILGFDVQAMDYDFDLRVLIVCTSQPSSIIKDDTLLIEYM